MLNVSLGFFMEVLGTVVVVTVKYLKVSGFVMGTGLIDILNKQLPLALESMWLYGCPIDISDLQ